jgi:hypothetical protein
VLKCSSLFLKHLFAIVRSKAYIKSRLDLPSTFISPKPYPHAIPQNYLNNSLHAHLDPPSRKIFLLMVYPGLSLLNPPKTLL